MNEHLIIRIKKLASSGLIVFLIVCAVFFFVKKRKQSSDLSYKKDLKTFYDMVSGRVTDLSMLEILEKKYPSLQPIAQHVLFHGYLKQHNLEKAALSGSHIIKRTESFLPKASLEFSKLALKSLNQHEQDLLSIKSIDDSIFAAYDLLRACCIAKLHKNPSHLEMAWDLLKQHHAFETLNQIFTEKNIDLKTWIENVKKEVKI